MATLKTDHGTIGRCPDTRMDRHAWVLESHEKDIQRIEKQVEVLSTSLTTIAETLTQIKYFCVGALSLLVLNALGITETIKAILSN
jgi:archaellum component FlaC